MSDQQKTEAPVGRVDLTVKGGVAYLALNNPAKLNAISHRMWRQIAAALDELAGDPDVRCLVIEGQGSRAFCTGADIGEKEELNAAGDAGHDDPTYPTLRALEAFPKPTIASISGYCIGAGLVLAGSCDLRVAAHDARFSFPAARLGLAPGYCAIRRLTDIVGPSSAKRILFLADRFDAAEAMRLGLVDEVAPEGALEAATQALVERIAANAPLTLAAAKFAIGMAVTGGNEADPAGYAALELACENSHDYREGLRAFAEKRQPRFAGR